MARTSELARDAASSGPSASVSRTNSSPDTCQSELAFQGEQQTLRNGDQQLIADIMAIGIIDGFETVEIHEHQGKMYPRGPLC